MKFPDRYFLDGLGAYLGLRPSEIRLAVAHPDATEVITVSDGTELNRLYLKRHARANPPQALLVQTDWRHGGGRVDEAWPIPEILLPPSCTPIDALRILCGFFGVDVLVGDNIRERLVLHRKFEGVAPGQLRIGFAGVPAEREGQIKLTSLARSSRDRSTEAAVLYAINAAELKRAIRRWPKNRRRNMKLKLGALADFANQTGNGKLNLMGIFDVISVGSVNSPLPPFFVALTIVAPITEGSQHDLRLGLFDSAGNEVLPLSPPTTLSFTPGGPGQPLIGQFAIQVTGIRVPAFGDYDFRIVIDAQVIGSVGFAVVERPPSGQEHGQG